MVSGYQYRSTDAMQRGHINTADENYVDGASMELTLVSISGHTQQVLPQTWVPRVELTVHVPHLALGRHRQPSSVTDIIVEQL